MIDLYLVWSEKNDTTNKKNIKYQYQNSDEAVIPNSVGIR